jgi:hypothetical protein
VINADRRTDLAKLIGAFSNYASRLKSKGEFWITVVWDVTLNSL